MDRHVLFLSSSPWDLPCRFRRHHFASHLARHAWKVFYVEPIQTVTNLLRRSGRDGVRNSPRTGRLRHPEDARNLIVYRPPPLLPLHVKSPAMAALNRRLLRGPLHRRAREHFGSNSYLQVVNHPQDRHLLRRDRPVVYDIMDRFSAYPEYRRSRHAIERNARTLAATADLVTATTTDLSKAAPPDKRVVIPNGVDLSHYRAYGPGSPPADLADLPSPRVVYVGALGPWFDFDLVEALAHRHPEMSFVLIGSPDGPLPRLRANVHCLGAKPWTVLPAYLWNCDLGIIPFVQNALTRDVDPLKFYEYVACDLPVVSIPMPSIEDFEAPGVLALAGDATAFSDGIARCLREADHGASDRSTIAERHDWSRLAQQYENVLDTVRTRS